MTVRFDQFLRTAQSAPANWSGRTFSDPFDYLFSQAVAPATVLGSAVTLTPQLGVLDGGPLTISYAATPPDLFGQCSDVPVEPFADFPMSGPTSYPLFVSGVFSPFPTRWTLTFSEAITAEPPDFNPAVWRTKQGPLTTRAAAVQIGAGKITLLHPSFSALDDTVVLTRQPPDWTDAEGDPVQAFSHALPS